MTVDQMATHAPPATIDAWFARQAAARGDAVAVTGRDGRLTYRELERDANRLAHHLRTLGVGPEVPVAVCMERTTGLVTALLAVLKAGGAYVPLDPSAPDGRLRFTLTDAKAAVLLTDTDGRGLRAAHTVLIGGPGGGVDLTAYPQTAPEDPGTGPASLAYVIYTSGSTGTPKGVMIEHRNVTGLLTGVRDRFGFGPDDVWSMCASAAFDVSVWEMWGALLHGGRLVVVPDEVRRSPQELHGLLHREGVTVLNQTPAAFRQLVRYEEESAAGDGSPAGLALRLVVFAGEALPPEMLRPWIARHGDEVPVLVNMYGITETTVHSTYRRMTSADLDGAAGSMIGGAIGGWTLEVLGADGERAADGEAGELYVGGAGVARGYLGRPALTAERFLPDPDAAVPGARRYRSGDSARRAAGGAVGSGYVDHEYLGRLDHQVKIRGYRIELGEIENALTRHPAVRDTVVVVDQDAAGAPRLVAYWVAAAGTPAGPSELREHLALTLPEYMLPNVYVALEQLPLTHNGKVDRRALPAPEAVRPELDAEFAVPGTPVEKALADIWAEVLSVDRVGLDDDFFELGGHSMLATEAVALTREQLGVGATLRLFFDRPTVRELASALDELLAVQHDTGDDSRSASHPHGEKNA
ncbi:amino acid adenylation domain-containing protein [Streptomyces sp. ISL-100]|uniref:amino acid adenylation domain-containing protein n=1 Tax=Streptomyces sp. ISL-100 TaxID=2819173 RepID=UPI001BE7368C|nr:amino acid adenylation domain-containing protein [Streptomyces sp. ISL-100]MBT2398635.1 amino acid adenylation domain-containing protein [Streptomyces sp. ISL-100]